MGLWQKGLVVFFAMLVLFQFSSVETKKKKKARNPLQVETLQKLCHGSSSSSRKNILELQAFFDLSKVSHSTSIAKCIRREQSRFWARREWFYNIIDVKKYVFLFFFAGFCMSQGGNLFANSSLFRWGYTRPRTRKPEILFAVESSPTRTTGKKWINNEKMWCFFFCLGYALGQ